MDIIPNVLYGYQHIPVFWGYGFDLFFLPNHVCPSEGFEYYILLLGYSFFYRLATFYACHCQPGQSHKESAE
jgi:hypothetical protein